MTRRSLLASMPAPADCRYLPGGGSRGERRRRSGLPWWLNAPVLGSVSTVARFHRPLAGPAAARRDRLTPRRESETAGATRRKVFSAERRPAPSHGGQVAGDRIAAAQPVLDRPGTNRASRDALSDATRPFPGSRTKPRRRLSCGPCRSAPRNWRQYRDRHPGQRPQSECGPTFPRVLWTTFRNDPTT